jgi:hypothetical protein
VSFSYLGASVNENNTQKEDIREKIAKGNKAFFVALRPNAGHGLLILEVSGSHKNDAPQSLGLLWTSDQLVAEAST